MIKIPFLAIDFPINMLVVTDNYETVKKLIDLGVSTIILRNKTLIGSALYQEIEKSVQYAQKHHVQLFINDDWWEALDCGAYGVHLGQDDLVSADLVALKKNNIRLSVSVHNVVDLNQALSVHPSLIVAGGIHEGSLFTPILTDYKEQLSSFLLLTKTIPLLVMGGITQTNICPILSLGVQAVGFENETLFLNHGMSFLNSLTLNSNKIVN